MITEKDYLKGRDAKYPLSVEQRSNMEKLLNIVNLVEDEYGKPFLVTSGYRDPETNQRAGGSPKSSHLSCEAIDIYDPDGKIKKWLADNNLLIKYNLYMEHPSATPSWAHLQTRPTRSGRRVFFP
jgi:hypothetical protein